MIKLELTKAHLAIVKEELEVVDASIKALTSLSGTLEDTPFIRWNGSASKERKAFWALKELFKKREQLSKIVESKTIEL